MGATRGKDFKLYLGGQDPYDYDMPVWVEITNTRDVTRGVDASLADASIRGSVFRQQVSTLLDLSTDTQMVYDTTDANMLTLQSAFYNRVNVLIADLDGSINTVGTRGIQYTAQVSKFTVNEALEDVGLVDITLVPGYDLDETPHRVIVNTPGTLTPDNS